MNKRYMQIAEVVIPARDYDEGLTALRVFDVDDEKADELHEIAYDPGPDYDRVAVELAIMEDLGVQDDYCVMPGAPFHRFSASFYYPHTVFLWDTLAYNV